MIDVLSDTYQCHYISGFKNLDRRVNGVLGSHPRLEHAGSDVLLIITSTCLKMKSLDSGDIIAVHDMPNISFASGGDSVSGICITA